MSRLKVILLKITTCVGSNPTRGSKTSFKGVVNFQGSNLGNVRTSLPALVVQRIRIRDYGSCDEGSNPSWGTQNEITKTRLKIREN